MVLALLPLNVLQKFLIVELAVKMGSIDENPNDKLRSKVEQGYFDFMANIILGFEPKKVA